MVWSQTITVTHPLIGQMIRDMCIREVDIRRQISFLQVVRAFIGFNGTTPDAATVDDLRRYLVHLANHGASRSTLAVTTTGLSFFFKINLGRPVPPASNWLKPLWQVHSREDREGRIARPKAAM